MELIEIVVTAGGAALIVLTLWFFFGKKAEGLQSAGKKAAYACPMHPWITSDDPAANCSVCGMKLVKSDD